MNYKKMGIILGLVNIPVFSLLLWMLLSWELLLFIQIGGIISLIISVIGWCCTIKANVPEIRKWLGVG